MDTIALWEQEIEENSKSHFFEQNQNMIDMLTESIELDYKLINLGIVEESQIVTESVWETVKEKIKKAIKAIRDFFTMIIGKIKSFVKKGKEDSKKMEEKIKENKEKENSKKFAEKLKDKKEKEESLEDKEKILKEKLEKLVQDNSPVYGFRNSNSIEEEFIQDVVDRVKDNTSIEYFDKEIDLYTKLTESKERVFRSTDTYDHDLKSIGNIDHFKKEYDMCLRYIDGETSSLDEINADISKLENVINNVDESKEDSKDIVERYSKAIKVLNLYTKMTKIILKEQFKTSKVLKQYIDIVTS